MGERLVCNQEVMGSNPFGSTTELGISDWGFRMERHEAVVAWLFNPQSSIRNPQ